jgi:hypothetical protein
MIRHIVLVKLKADHDPARVAELQEGFRNLNCPGTVSYTLADDLRLRDGNWSYAIVADFKDTDSYLAYDQDAEHERLRGLIAPMVDQIGRLQFEIPG